MEFSSPSVVAAVKEINHTALTHDDVS